MGGYKPDASVIRHAAITSADPDRFVAAVFDDASALVDVTTDKGADPAIGNEIHALIDSLAACVADDLQEFPRGLSARKPRDNRPKPPSSGPRPRR